MNKKQKRGVGIAAYVIVAILIFGEATQHFKTDNVLKNDIRGVPALTCAIAWPLYLSYRVFDNE